MISDFFHFEITFFTYFHTKNVNTFMRLRFCFSYSYNHMIMSVLEKHRVSIVENKKEAI